MNKPTYILAAIILALALGWMNVYEYIPDGNHGLWRINRLTNTVSYAGTSSNWETINEE